MNVLRRVLYLQAGVSAALGIPLVVAPRLVLVNLLQQPAYPDYSWARITGIGAFAMALLMVLVAHHAEQTWWWSWAFVVLRAGEGLVATLNALFGLPDGAAAWPWWAFAGLSWAFVAGLVYGLARAGVERPPV
ncbi:MAG: hypothetical protein ACRDIX_05310 [Actinomycetota bacterium]